MDMRSFYCPKSVAVFGAPWLESAAGHGILTSLIRDGYEGSIYPIDSQAPELQGITTFANLRSIGEVPQLVVVAVPAENVKQVVQDCANLGVKAVVIISSGFRESGDDGSSA